MLRSTKHHILDTNDGKYEKYLAFVEEYSRVAKIVIDKVWRDLPQDLSLDKYLDYKTLDIDTNLSARALSSLFEQVSGIIRSSIEKQRRRYWVQQNRNPEIKVANVCKPKIDFVSPGLGSKCCNIHKCENGKFWGFVELGCLGKTFGKIRIPIIKHPRMGENPRVGVVFFKKSVQLAWDMPTTPVQRGDKIVGIDTGLKSVATLSDGQTTPDIDSHGHSYEAILEKMSRKRKGSNAFRKAAAHRKNFVHWAINRLNFAGVKEIRLEKVVNIRFGRRTSKKLSSWSNPEISDKIKRLCEKLEVPVIEQSCAYRSQRCSKCGNVRKSNRKGKLYVCRSCGFSADADFNAAINHSIDLPPCPKVLTGQKLNLGKGFFWKPTGFFAFDGAELRVPLDARISKSS